MLPSIEEIKNAISHPGNILIPSLKGYKTVPGILGPEMYSGGFSVVFPFSDGVHKKALRVWHKEIPEIKKRTHQVSSYLSSLNLPYFVNYEYFTQALRFSTGDRLDVVLMDWAEGVTLKEYIDNILTSTTKVSQKKELLLTLAKSFYSLFLELHNANISHGDLQHGNILIKDATHITLIDYDSLYVPTMGANVSQVTVGLSGYQHPLRKKCPYSDKTSDYFSELIIISSLMILSEFPDIWKKFSLMEDDYSFVFNAQDFENMRGSKLYKTIYSKNPITDKFLLEIERFLSKGFQSLLPIDKVIEIIGLDWNSTSYSCYCTNCGNKFEFGDIFCIKCGTKRL